MSDYSPVMPNDGQAHSTRTRSEFSILRNRSWAGELGGGIGSGDAFARVEKKRIRRTEETMMMVYFSPGDLTVYY